MTDILFIVLLLSNLICWYLLLRKVVWRSELEQTTADILNKVVDLINKKVNTQKLISKLIGKWEEKI